ncbi:hypothetical protein [Morganella morganii]|uniref:hypothetical protein n=1 Tax=Morganella morganii TaxID=582 RepID=UPI0024B81BFF|nr:hypothetical protein [Morganella morganii]MDI9764707.1 hypothetical protein [Morganella morganii]
MTTAESGQLKVLQKLMSLGAINVSVCKEGRRTFIKFDSPTGKKYKVTTRAKMSGTWQTSINYANKCVPDKNDDEFWIFIDIRKEPATFYITPLSWIQNNIYEAHSGYRKYKPPFCSSSEVSYLKFPHSFTAQAPILTAGPA